MTCSGLLPDSVASTSSCAVRAAALRDPRCAALAGRLASWSLRITMTDWVLLPPVGGAAPAVGAVATPTAVVAAATRPTASRAVLARAIARPSVETLTVRGCMRHRIGYWCTADTRHKTNRMNWPEPA